MACEEGTPIAGEIDCPSQETIAAIREAERIAKDPSVPGHHDLDALFADLKD